MCSSLLVSKISTYLPKILKSKINKALSSKEIYFKKVMMYLFYFLILDY